MKSKWKRINGKERKLADKFGNENEKNKRNEVLKETNGNKKKTTASNYN